MKLLFDQNLSFRLVRELQHEFPESLHVRDIGLAEATDADVWRYGKQYDLILVSKDTDFQQRALLYGAPPKVVWLRIGNCSTQQVVDLLRQKSRLICEFAQDQEASFLVLGV